MNLDSSIRELKGIGSKTEELFQNLGVYTIRDILLHFPREYHRYEQPKKIAELRDGEATAVQCRILKTPLVRRGGRMAITTTTVSDETGTLACVWFRMPYLKNTLKPGTSYVFYGNIKDKKGVLTMEQPRIYHIDQYRLLTEGLQPVYALTKGLTNNAFGKAVGQALELSYLLEEYLPEDLREKRGLMDYQEAVRQLHFPEKEHSLVRARNRLAYDDFFQFILMMQMSKEQRSTQKNEFSFGTTEYVESVIAKIPYTLTHAQKKAVSEIGKDMRSGFVMQRLLQGDVGSGKTIVAFLAMADAAHSGYQSAIMVPTEVLARQHYENFSQMCQDYGVEAPVIL